MTERVWINGLEGDGVIPVTDSSVLRGDGCFEVMRGYGGNVFALEAHLERLESSAEALQIELPARHDIEAWVTRAAADRPDAAIRVVVTRGDALVDSAPETKVIVFAHNWKRMGDSIGLASVGAPWHPAGESWSLLGAKVLSYAPNLAATRTAQERGFDDAILVASNGSLLEGPTFSVAWVVDGALETPSLELGILDSITRRHIVTEARGMGIQLTEGVWNLDRLNDAEEIFVMSTIREVQAVTAVDDRNFPHGPITRRLAAAYGQRVGSASLHGV